MNFLQRDSFLTRVLSRLIDCMLLSILWLFTSIPVVTIGASTTAAYSVALKLAAGEHPALVSGYFAAFKKNILRSTAVFLALTGTGLFIGLDLWCVLQWETPFQFALEVLILSVGLFHILRKNPALYPHFWNDLWINIVDIEPVEDNSMIHGLMTVPGHQNPVPWPDHSRDSAENPPAASIYQIIRPA